MIRSRNGIVWSSLAVLSAVPSLAQLGTNLTYQGQLKLSGAPAEGTFDLRFRLYTAAIGGSQVGSDDCSDGVIPVDGLFTADIDFGAAPFDGNARWLEIAVRADGTPGNCAGGAAYTVLSPRQPLTAAPYALFAPGFWTASGANIHNNNAGNVGVGTAAAPLGKLHVVGGVGQFGLRVNSQDVGVYGSHDPATGSAPGVLGTTASAAAGAHGVRGLVTTASPANDCAGVFGSISAVSTGNGYGVHGKHGGTGYGVFGESLSTSTGAGVYGNGRYGVLGIANSAASGIGGVFSGGGSFGSGLALWSTGDQLIGGSLRIGSTGLFDTPIAKLQIESNSDSQPNGGGFVVLGDVAAANLSLDNNEIMARSNGVVSAIYINHNGGDVNIGQASGGTTILRAPVVEITGGADLSENFDVASSPGAKVVPGMVVCIDPRNAGKLIPSTRGYDRTVAGIISGAGGVKPGMRMGQDGTIADGEHPVALSGRVYVYCDASHVAVQAGDLLTTSDIPGHAMKVADYPRAQGAIIGKAMSELKAGERGLVLVLVNLQ